MPRLRLLVLAFFLAALAAACGDNPSAPSSPTAPSTATAPSSGAACQLTSGKVQVVISYARDRSKISSPQLTANPPLLVLVDFADPSVASGSDSLTKIDDYTWTRTVFVTPNVDPMSHGASVVDLAVGQVSPSGGLNPNVVTGVTANGVQVRKITFNGRDLGYFGVDVCGRIFV